MITTGKSTRNKTLRISISISPSWRRYNYATSCFCFQESLFHTSCPTQVLDRRRIQSSARPRIFASFGLSPFLTFNAICVGRNFCAALTSTMLSENQPRSNRRENWIGFGSNKLPSFQQKFNFRASSNWLYNKIKKFSGPIIPTKQSQVINLI